jgi:hypothetical protein
LIIAVRLNRKAKVRNFDLVVVNENIRRLQIPVHHPALKKIIVGIYDLTENVEGLGFFQRAFVKEFLEVALVAILQNKVNVVVGLTNFEHFNEARVGEPFHRFDFSSNEVRVCFGLKEFFVYDFDGNRLFRMVMDALEDLRKGTASQTLVLRKSEI